MCRILVLYHVTEAHTPTSTYCINNRQLFQRQHSIHTQAIVPTYSEGKE